MNDAAPLILSLGLDPRASRALDALRREHFPPHLNRTPRMSRCSTTCRARRRRGGGDAGAGLRGARGRRRRG
jgi:hypothetical protein